MIKLRLLTFYKILFSSVPNEIKNNKKSTLLILNNFLFIYSPL